MTSTPVAYEWSRLTHPYEIVPERDGYGWVTESAFWQRDEVLPLSGLRDKPVVVVLGERGFGKSDAMNHELNELRAAGRQVRLVELGRVSAAQAHQRLTTALKPTSEALTHILLDGLDDAPASIGMDTVLAEVLDEFAPADLSGVRLRISSRTSQWPHLLSDAIATAFGTEPERVIMAGLTRGDALKAAHERGVAEPERFAEALEARRLVPLASRPVTFIPLLESWAADQTLPETMSQAYEAACRQLCREKDKAGAVQKAPARDLVAIAERAAVALQFSGRSALAEVPGTEVVSFDDLAGAGESAEPSPENAYTVAGLLQLTESGLLVQPGTAKRWVFAHRSFQEYLAAAYLRRHPPASLQREALLMVGHGPSRRPATAQREVAAWIASYNDEVFEDLLVCDPPALLLGDLTSRGAQDRARLVDALADQVRHGTAHYRDRDLYGQLDDEMATVRISHLLAESDDPSVLLFALSLAEACPRDILAAPLLKIAEDHGLPEMLRTLALTGLTRIIARNPSGLDPNRLRTLAGDPEPEVAARALTLLWPEHIATRDLLDALPTPSPGSFGYAGMLLERLHEQIPIVDLQEAAAWSARALEAADPRNPGTPVYLALRVLTRIVEEPSTGIDSDDATIASAAKALIAASAIELTPTAEIERTRLNDALSQNTLVRRALALAALVVATDGQVKALSAFYPIALFLGVRDAGYLALSYPSLPAKARALVRHTLRHGPLDPNDPRQQEDWEAVFDLRAHHPGLAEATEHWYSLPHDDPAAAEYRDQCLARIAEQQTTADQTYGEAAVRQSLTRAAAAHTDARAAWRDVLTQLNRTPQGLPVVPLVHLDPAGIPSLPASGSDLDRDVATAADRIITQAPLIGSQAFAGVGIDLRDVPELIALALLEFRGRTWPDLDTRRWAGLAAALLFLSAVDPKSEPMRARLLDLAVVRAGDELPNLLPSIVGELRGLSGATYTLISRLPEPSRAALRQWAAGSKLDPEVQVPVLAALAHSGDGEAARSIADLLTKRPSTLRGPEDSRPVVRWLTAARAAVQLDPAHWSPVIDRLDRLPDLVVPLLRHVVRDTSFGKPATEVFALRAADLERLYQLAARHLPTVAGTVDELRSLRYQVLSALATIDSPGKLDALERLAAGDIDDPLLDDALDTGRRRDLDATWTPRDPAELFTVLTAANLRVVNDVHQLRQVVTESLDRLQALLRTENGWAIALWNQDKIPDCEQPQNPPATAGSKSKKPSRWRPKIEADLSDFTATFLRYDLAGHKVVVNREVEVSRPGLNGGRTDITIQALADKRAARPELLTVIIEAKGCWNDELDTALLDQLVAKYLSLPGARAGIYLIGYFDDHPYWRHVGLQRLKRDHSVEAIRAAQQAHANRTLTEFSQNVGVVVMDCRLPGSRASIED